MTQDRLPEAPAASAASRSSLHPSGNLPDVAYATIRDAILTGSIGPNTRLNQLALAEQLSVSQRTIREALARLVEHGLAVHEPNKGVQTIELEPDDFEDLYFIRGCLESEAMRHAAAMIRPEELAEMKNLLPSTGGALSVDDGNETGASNRQFHWIAIRACKRLQLIRMLEQTWNLLNLSFTYSLRETVPVSEVTTAVYKDIEEHALLLEALSSQDGEKASRIAVEHIQRGFRNLRSRWLRLRQECEE